jgi:lysophospholipase L1-like esterase
MKGVFDVKNNADLVLRDRIHPSAKGTAIMAENISPYIILLLQSYLVPPAR